MFAPKPQFPEFGNLSAGKLPYGMHARKVDKTIKFSSSPDIESTGWVDGEIHSDFATIRWRSELSVREFAAAARRFLVNCEIADPSRAEGARKLHVYTDDYAAVKSESSPESGSYVFTLEDDFFEDPNSFLSMCDESKLWEVRLETGFGKIYWTHHFFYPEKQIVAIQSNQFDDKAVSEFVIDTHRAPDDQSKIERNLRRYLSSGRELHAQLFGH